MVDRLGKARETLAKRRSGEENERDRRGERGGNYREEDFAEQNLRVLDRFSQLHGCTKKKGRGAVIKQRVVPVYRPLYGQDEAARAHHERARMCKDFSLNAALAVEIASKGDQIERIPSLQLILSQGCLSRLYV